jgi:hypothetical protein
MARSIRLAGLWTPGQHPQIIMGHGKGWSRMHIPPPGITIKYGAQFDQALDQPADGSALPPGGWIAKYCFYDSGLIRKLKTSRIRIISGIFPIKMIITAQASLYS